MATINGWQFLLRGENHSKKGKPFSPTKRQKSHAILKSVLWNIISLNFNVMRSGLRFTCMRGDELLLIIKLITTYERGTSQFSLPLAVQGKASDDWRFRWGMVSIRWISGTSQLNCLVRECALLDILVSLSNLTHVFIGTAFYSALRDLLISPRLS